ncbi:MAG: type II secretion system F family protein [Clostridia bacterium]|nr:type II secretion system F family protein [Clostridia bacterium]
MNRESLNRKAGKRMILIATVGIIIIAADLFMAGNDNTLALHDSNKGLYMIRPGSGEASGKISLRARVAEKDYSRSFDITLDSFSSEKNASPSEDKAASGSMKDDELVAYEIRSAVHSLNDNTSVRRVYLPDRLDTGEQIIWSVERENNTVAIAFAAMILAALVYRNRYAPLKKKLQAEQDSITRQLPEFVNRLVLLLNAGMVLNSAFEKAVEESPGEDYFYGQMHDIYSRVKQTNGSMNREFRAFAKSRRAAGDDAARQLMRISNIINDNISKGVELTEKLQAESEMLWISRKLNCEERGRLAETKLTLPLTLFLLVLIIITVSPALLEL